MNEQLERQLERTRLIENIFNERLEEYTEGSKKYQEWQNTFPRIWERIPKTITKSKVIRVSQLLREELVKLDRML